MTMAFPLVLSNSAALLGMAFGTAGFVMGLMGYLRDSPRVKVFLKWDMVDPATSQKIGIVRITNVGRRPIYISAVALEPPKGVATHLVLEESLQGTKLSEGDAPLTFVVSYEKLPQFSKKWHKIRAYAEDSAGCKYFSRRLPGLPVPSWAAASGRE